MTIAVAYLTNEGVVFGADSTTTCTAAVRYDCAQKIFEYGGVGSSLGFMAWGIGSLGSLSYRQFVAETADLGPQQHHASFSELAQFASDRLWLHYTNAFGPMLQQAQALYVRLATLTPPEKQQLDKLKNSFSGGFCLGGRWGSSRQTHGYSVLFDPTMTAAPAPKSLTPSMSAWGCPQLLLRVIHGIDPRLVDAILQSGKWTGTRTDIENLVQQGVFYPPSGFSLPIREAIDYVYAMAYTTIKAMKFSQFGRLCGGPIEVAVITSDRPFRWVRHKPLGQALDTHLLEEA